MLITHLQLSDIEIDELKISTEHLGTDASSENIYQTLSAGFNRCKDSKKEVFEQSVIVLNEAEQKYLLKQQVTSVVRSRKIS